MDFVVIGTHPPNLCPSSNATVRKGMVEGFPKMADLGKSLGVEVTFFGVPMVQHKIFMLAKARNYEDVRNLLIKAGILQSNTVEIYPTVSFEEAMKQVGSLPTIF